MEATQAGITAGDCLELLKAVEAKSVNLLFADPPFNIGYDYDVYEDSLDAEKYITWSRDWMTLAYEALASDGAFWLAIGDEYAAELKIEAQNIGFHPRSWVIWYYTFGVNCSKKFTRSHAHLFHFVKDPNEFTFRDEAWENRIPSARQLVYADKRANPRGRLPDDTWIIRPANAIGELVAGEPPASFAQLNPPVDADRTWTLRPQDLDECFQQQEDTWYFPRVAGTFKERAGFHGCQMPEQLLGRIIRTCSHEGDLVLDPFSGSATTLAVAKKLHRRYLGFDISQEYVEHGLRRLQSIRVGDPLDGSAEPLLSAPQTNGRRESERDQGPLLFDLSERAEDLAPETDGSHLDAGRFEMTLRGVKQAFVLTHQGWSVDRVVADPKYNQPFVAACQQAGLVGDARTWNVLLFRMRKTGRLADVPITRHTDLSWQACEKWQCASEIALQTLRRSSMADTLSEVLCDPYLAEQFDDIAYSFAPNRTSFEYRWAAVQLCQQAPIARERSAVLDVPRRLGPKIPIAELNLTVIPKHPGICLIRDERSQPLLVCETMNLRQRLAAMFNQRQRKVWLAHGFSAFSCQVFAADVVAAGSLCWQSCFAQRFRPALNICELYEPESP